MASLRKHVESKEGVRKRPREEEVFADISFQSDQHSDKYCDSLEFECLSQFCGVTRCYLKYTRKRIRMSSIGKLCSKRESISIKVSPQSAFTERLLAHKCAKEHILSFVWILKSCQFKLLIDFTHMLFWHTVFRAHTQKLAVTAHEYWTEFSFELKQIHTRLCQKHKRFTYTVGCDLKWTFLTWILLFKNLLYLKILNTVYFRKIVIRLLVCDLGRKNNRDVHYFHLSLTP